MRKERCYRSMIELHKNTGKNFFEKRTRLRYPSFFDQIAQKIQEKEKKNLRENNVTHRSLTELHKNTGKEFFFFLRKEPGYVTHRSLTELHKNVPKRHDER